MNKHLRVLGVYVAVVAAAHICLYIVLNVFSERFGWLFYFDTRIGFFFIETVIKHSEGTPPALTAWVIELGEFIVGVSMALGKNLLKIYLVIESILTIPYVLFFILIMAAGMSANHGFSPAELFLPTATVLFACVIPLTYAFWILWRFRAKGSLSIA
jgi:hypothetical protein